MLRNAPAIDKEEARQLVHWIPGYPSLAGVAVRPQVLVEDSDLSELAAASGWGDAARPLLREHLADPRKEQS